MTIENGRVEQTNFDQYPMLRIGMRRRRSRCTSSRATTRRQACGEPALPPVAPAICNAIFAATGQRVRTLPLRVEGYQHLASKLDLCG